MEDVRKQFKLYRNIQYAITLILSASDTFEDAVPKILKILAETLRCGLAEFWKVDREINALRFAEA